MKNNFKLNINDNNSLRMNVIFKLNRMYVVIEEKNSRKEWENKYQKRFIINEDSLIDDLLYEMYIEYSNLQNIENYWSTIFTNENVDKIYFNTEEENKSEEEI